MTNDRLAEIEQYVASGKNDDRIFGHFLWLITEVKRLRYLVELAIRHNERSALSQNTSAD